MFEQRVAHVHLVVHGAGVEQPRRRGFRLRRLPALAHLGEVAAEPNGIDFARAGIDADGDAARQLLAARVGDVLEEKALALHLVEPAKLPPHERHQFGVLVDRTLDAHELAAPLEIAEVRAQILQIAVSGRAFHRCAR